MAINLNKRNRIIGVLILLIIVFALPIINLDREIRFSCTSINEDFRIAVKCYAEPLDSRFINEELEVSLKRRYEFLPKENYLAKVYKVNNSISYYNGIAYRPIYCEIPEGTFSKEDIILVGAVKIEKVSIFKFIHVSTLNWLEPYSGERIILK